MGTTHSESNTCFTALFYMEDSEKTKPFGSFVIAVSNSLVTANCKEPFCVFLISKFSGVDGTIFPYCLKGTYLNLCGQLTLRK